MFLARDFSQDSGVSVGLIRENTHASRDSGDSISCAQSVESSQVSAAAAIAAHTKGIIGAVRTLTSELGQQCNRRPKGEVAVCRQRFSDDISTRFETKRASGTSCPTGSFVFATVKNESQRSIVNVNHSCHWKEGELPVSKLSRYLMRLQKEGVTSVYVESEDPLVGVQLSPTPEIVTAAFHATILEAPNHSAISLVQVA